MRKSTVCFPEDLELAIADAARTLGISKAEFIRRAVERVADETMSAARRRPRSYKMLPHGTGRLSVEQMRATIYESMERRASKR